MYIAGSYTQVYIAFSYTLLAYRASQYRPLKGVLCLLQTEKTMEGIYLKFNV